MLTLPVYDQTGKEVGKYEIDPSEIAPRISKQLLHDVVVMYQARQRQGTFATKGRGEVAGSTKKMYRQRGTGNARAGSRRSGVRRGGGHIFAKKPRDFGYSMPKKAVRGATRMALAAKLRDSQVMVLADLKLEQPKTKQVVDLLGALKLTGSTALLTTAAYDLNVYKSARNIAGVSVAPVAELNAFKLLSPRVVLITKAALDSFKSKKTV